MGRLCCQGHFNRPDAYYCCDCGLSMAGSMPTLVQRPRPLVAVLSLDSGRVLPLARGCILGGAAEGEGPACEYVALDDPSVDDLHLELRFHGWEMFAVDLSSTGTFLATGTPPRWRRLTPGDPLEIAEPTLLRLGPRRIAALEPWRG